MLIVVLFWIGIILLSGILNAYLIMFLSQGAPDGGLARVPEVLVVLTIIGAIPLAFIPINWISIALIYGIVTLILVIDELYYLLVTKKKIIRQDY